MESNGSSHEVQHSKPNTAITAKIAAWLTAAAIPALFICSLFDTIGHAGLGGIVLLFFLIPLSIIAMLILRLILGPFYKVLLNKNANIILRVVFAGVGVILAAVFIYQLFLTEPSPYRVVSAVVEEIPEIEDYFLAHKDELENQRLQAGSDKDFSVKLDEYSSGMLWVSFRYSSAGSETTGYKKTYHYTYRLDEYWYIDIYLSPAI